jgi:hypothetical protein
MMASFSAAALEMRLDWVVGDKKVVFSESITAEGSGYSALITTNVGEEDRLTMDARRSTLRWSRKVASEGTDLVALRSGSKVSITGSYKGRPYEKTHDFGDLPWYQFQEISYEELHRTKAAERSFWTIDRASLKPSLFKAELSGPTSIEAMGAPAKALKYDLYVNGVPAFLFTSHFWLRESDGRFLRLEVPPIFNLPRSRVDLTSESE